MKKIIFGVFAVLGLMAAQAEGVPLVPEGYAVFKYVSSEASGNPWASNKVGPYLQIYNSDKTPFVLGANDVVETKFNFVEANKGACVFCDRTSSSAGKFSFMRTGNSGNPGRFDYGTENNPFTSPSLANTSMHTVVASGKSLKVDGTAVTVTPSTYEPSSNALLIFCCDKSGNGQPATSNDGGNPGQIRIYYFRVKDGNGSIRMNLVPMKNENGVAGMYDQVSGQFFTSASSDPLTAGGNATLADILESFTPGTDPAATGGDYILKDGDAYLHVFTSSATLTLSSNATADMLLVGGGGGGGYNAAGGGAGGAVVEIANKSISAGSYAVTVGAGGAHETSQSYIWGGTGGTSSVADIDGASAAGGSGGVGWNGSSDGGDALRDCAGWGGSNGTSYGAGGGSNTQYNGGDGKASEILGVSIVFGGGGGKGDGTQANSNILQGGAGGGGQGACRFATGNSSTAGAGLAKNGTNFLGGGGGGGAGGGQQDQACTSGADGGSGIVVVRLTATGEDPGEDDPGTGGDEPVDPPHTHDWSEWVTTVEPQVGVPGEKQRTCSGCGEVETEVIPALPEPSVADAMLNFGSTEKSIRPALHGCGVAPRTRALGKSNETQILKDAGFYSCRAHDLALHDGAQAIVDLQQIFPLFSKDPDDPASYRFEPTDRVLAAITNAGMKIIFRLGSCGQSHGDDTHEYYNNIFTPSSDNYDKIAAVFSKIIAHYNEGWNRGFNLGIEYWEIWNEPDADPGNRWPSNNAASEFPQLFAKVVKKVKTDHPSVKIGGPASFQLDTSFFDSCLSACNTAGVCPDFYTFHYYSHYCGAAKDPADLTTAVENMRSHLASKTCAGKSCADIEIGVTEWNYYSGPSTEWYGRLTMEGAAWCAGVAQDLQYSTADFSNWYGAGWNASFGIYNGRDGVLSKTYYSLKMVGQVVKNYTKLAARTDTDTLHVLGAVNDAGTKGCIMVTERTTTARNFTVGLDGFAGKTLSNIKCYVTDGTRDMAEISTGFTLQANAPDAVTFAKGATQSVWLITFDIAE